MTAAAILLLAACGAPESEDPGTSSAGTAAEAARTTAGPDSGGSPDPTAATTTTRAAADAVSGDLTENQALIVIGDERFEFTVECQMLPGPAATGRDLTSADTGDNGRADLSFELYDISADTPSRDSEGISVTDEENGRVWQADFQTEGSGIISTRIEGSLVSGSAVFIDTASPSPQSVRGSFDIVCGRP